MTTATVAPTSAVALLAALRTVVKRMQHTPMPIDEHTQAAWKQSPPAPRHVAALMQIVADERMSVSTLASRLGVSLATASQVVTDLETSGLVARSEDPTDRRRTLVEVAETHRALAQTLLDTRYGPAQRALDRMRPAEQRSFVRGLELLAEELETPTDV